MTAPLRPHSLLGRREHTALFYVGEALDADAVAALEAVAKTLCEVALARLAVCPIAAADVDMAATQSPLIRDTQGLVARGAAATALSAFVVRPDGYLG